MAKRKGKNRINIFKHMKKQKELQDRIALIPQSRKKTIADLFSADSESDFAECLASMLADKERQMKEMEKTFMKLRKKEIPPRKDIKIYIQLGLTQHRIECDNWEDIESMTIREVYESFIENLRHELRHKCKYSKSEMKPVYVWK